MRLRIALAATALALAAPSTVQAAFIIGATSASVSADLGTADGTDPANVINKSGLSSVYTSGVTDFSSYVATTTHATNDPLSGNPNFWMSLSGNSAGNFDFDLGGTYTIQSFALWNLATPAHVNLFELIASTDASFTNTTLLGSFTSNPSGPDTAVQAEVFTFAATSAAFVRLRIINNASPDDSNAPVGFGEAAFDGTPSDVTATPAPSSLVLLATGGVFGLAGLLRRRLVQPTAAKA